MHRVRNCGLFIGGRLHEEPLEEVQGQWSVVVME